MHLILAGVVAIAALLQVYAEYDKKPITGDEGYLLAGAQRVIGGQVPYRDFSAYAVVGSFYLYAAILKLFKGFILAPRLLLMLLYPLFAVLAFFAIKRLTGNIALAFLSVLIVPAAYTAFIDVFNLDYNLVSSFLGLAAILLLVYSVAEDDRSLSFIAGASCALAFLSKHNVGFFLAAAGFFSLVVLRERMKALVFSAGALAITLPFATYLAANGALQAAIQQTIRFGQLYSSTSFVPLKEVTWYGFSYSYHLLAVILPPLTIFLALRFEKDSFRKTFAIITAFFLIALFLSILPSLNPKYLARGFPLVLLPLAFCVKHLYEKRNRGVLGFAGFVLALLLISLLSRASLTMSLRSGYASFASYDLNGAKIALYPYHADFASVAIPIIKTAGPNALFVYESHPFWYVLAGARNPTRNDAWNYGAAVEEDYENALQVLEGKRIPFIISEFGLLANNQSGYVKYDQSIQQKKRMLEEYIDDKYAVLIRANPEVNRVITLYVRKDQIPA